MGEANLIGTTREEQQSSKIQQERKDEGENQAMKTRTARGITKGMETLAKLQEEAGLRGVTGRKA